MIKKSFPIKHLPYRRRRGNGRNRCNRAGYIWETKQSHSEVKYHRLSRWLD